MIDIIIPSNKVFGELSLMVNILKQYDDTEYNYIVTGFNGSASLNRNYGLIKACESKNEYIIMMDDDIFGRYENWQHDLIKPLIEDENVKISSARLITRRGEYAPMMGVSMEKTDDEYTICNGVVVSACIAFRKKDINDIWFDNRYVGSGFEDTDFCMQMNNKFPGCKFIVNNECRLVHRNEMKNQKETFYHNRNYFAKKWNRPDVLEMQPYFN